MGTTTPDGVDLDRLRPYLAANVEGTHDAPLTATLIAGGRSNLTYSVSDGTHTWVLRRPPLGHVLPTAHDMVREYRVMRALAPTVVPVPRTLALCEDLAVNDAPFYVMELVEGVIYRDGNALAGLSPDDARRTSEVLVDVLADIHAVDYTAVGLGAFGRPDGFLERQVRRWGEQWERSKTRELPEVDELARRLRMALPTSGSPTIVHGDYRLDNTMMANDDPGRIVAVLDWEMSTLGDPLADLGLFLLYWGRADAQVIATGSAIGSQEGFLFARDEVVERYARVSGRPVDQMDWYQCFAAYKLAIIVEGINARYQMGKTLGEGFEAMGAMVSGLINGALDQANGSEIAALPRLTRREEDPMGVLDGVKVVELAEFGFVPSCGAVLADWGADVVKVERVTGDPLRHVQGAGLVADTGDFNFLWEQMNRNKRGIALDLRSDAGRDALDRILEQADVVITNFLPSARASLRLEPDDVWAVNPRLVYAKGHGQGQRGPDADLGGFDSVSYWARGGLGHVLTPTDGPLVMQRAAMGDGPSGAFLAGGVAAALYQREKSGNGSVVDVALLGTAVWTLAPDLVATTILRTDPEPLGGGTVLSSPLIGPYRTGDGRWLLLNMMDDVRHWEPTCRALGLQRLLDDPRFADTAGRADHRIELHDAFADTIGSRHYAGLRAALAAEDTIFSVMAAPTEVIDDPQVTANGYLAAHPDHTTARLASAPCQFDDEPLVIRCGAPDIGEHTDAILAEAGFDADQIRDLHDTGAVA